MSSCVCSCVCFSRNLHVVLIVERGAEPQVPVTSSNDCLSRAGHVLVATDRLWLFGGYGSGTVPAPVCWSITGGVWSPTPHHMNNVDALHRKYLTVTVRQGGGMGCVMQVS